jgi:hypothetical protein
MSVLTLIIDAVLVLGIVGVSLYGGTLRAALNSGGRE